VVDDLNAKVCALGMALISVSACVHVAPHEREYLSRPSMDPKTEAGEAAFQAHLRESREGATASSGASGGGCGCN
jgi:hypothetical protein